MRNPFKTFIQERPTVEEVAPRSDDKEAIGADSKDATLATERPPSSQGGDDDSINKDAQAGVQKMEAITKTWTKRDLYLAYTLIWFIYFIDAIQQGMGFLLTPYVTSSFQEHSLTATVGVAANIIGGISKLPLAKILDVWGRPQGYLLTMSSMTLGLVLMAACNNVNTYAAAQIFYWVGYNGISYTSSVFIADTSALKNRGFVLAYVSSPYIITVWVTGPLAQSVLNGIGWRWAFGIFAIITPIICLPLYFLFAYNQRKAVQQGILVRPKSGRTVMQSIVHYFWEFDIICLILVSGGFTLFLLPFSIATSQRYGWRDPLTISFLVVGFVLLGLAVVWEKYWAPVKFLPWRLLKDRTVLGACVLAAVLFIEYYIWTAYFTSFLQVVLRLKVWQTGYIGNIYSIGSTFFSLIVGVAIRKTGRFKWVALYFGVPVTILAIGLLIHFRHEGTPLGWIIFVEIIYAFAGGACVIAEQVAVMAAASHQEVAVVLAIEGLFSSVGGGIGGTVAGAIWTGIFPRKLLEYLPAETKDQFATIYGDLAAQISYPVGSATHTAIVRAYDDALKNMFIAATTITVIGLAGVIAWRDIRLKDFKQVKGNVW
ncbi:siderophore iron transporter mirB [Xylaria bambusicola]|uniref:siderophore iron transporter mirB n=1 Tax=Xylaria bambusicola TaxID=326684 RepID=UPI002007451D|nr:siderophore iron transporter mirB [Xylaria bambusicola]KAI0505337.1 siderophore iron transporter mirB [Xylaria bambusicola]